MINKLSALSKVFNFCTGSLTMLFCYAALSKLVNYQESKKEMLNQPFPDWLAVQLVWVIPLLELVITISLLIPALRVKGLYASLLILTIFSVYILFAMTSVFGYIPCSCGGILKNMGYEMHLIFNLLFVIIATIGILIEKHLSKCKISIKKERSVAQN